MHDAIQSVADGAAFLDDLRRALPSITFSIECFHYEKKKVRQDAEGALVHGNTRECVFATGHSRHGVVW